MTSWLTKKLAIERKPYIAKRRRVSFLIMRELSGQKDASVRVINVAENAIPTRLNEK